VAERAGQRSAVAVRHTDRTGLSVGGRRGRRRPRRSATNPRRGGIVRPPPPASCLSSRGSGVPGITDARPAGRRPALKYGGGVTDIQSATTDITVVAAGPGVCDARDVTAAAAEAAGRMRTTNAFTPERLMNVRRALRWRIPRSGKRR